MYEIEYKMNICHTVGDRRNFRLQTSQIKAIDAIDVQIIDLLQENSRLSFHKIAHKLGISTGTAFNRIKSLENSGILKSYTAIVDST